MAHELSVYDLAFLHRQKDPSVSGVDPTSAKRLKRRVYDHYGNLLPNAQDYIPQAYHRPGRPEPEVDKQAGPSSLGIQTRTSEDEGEGSENAIPKARGRGRPVKQPIPYRSGHIESSDEEIRKPTNDKDLPSEVFLEAIYRFTSQHYTQVGVLPDKRYRWKKGKARWNAREADFDDDLSSETGFSSIGGDNEDEVIEGEEEEYIGEEEEENMEGDEEEEEPHIDMCNAFDGSALVAMALLLKEQMKADLVRAYGSSFTDDPNSQSTSRLLEELMNMASMESED